METVNHEYYVSLEVAKLLKEAGFDWECRGYFDGIEFHPNGSVECTNYNSNTCKYIKAPTLEVAQRWLREMKEIDAIVTYEAVLNEKTDVYEKKYAVVVYDAFIREDNNYHDTYEEAQEAGIKKALELILDKEE